MCESTQGKSIIKCNYDFFSMCLKYWMVSAPVEPTTIAVILTSCSNGNGAEAAHRMLSRICEAILKLDSSQISLGERFYFPS